MISTKKFKAIAGLTLISLLTACGGGERSDPLTTYKQTVVEASLSEYDSVTMIAGSSLDVTLTATVTRTNSTDPLPTIESMHWTLSNPNGATLTPSVSNSSCESSDVLPDYSTCTTTVAVPSNLYSGTWTLTGTARASTGESDTASVPLLVSNNYFFVSTGATQTISATNGIYPVVTLTGIASGQGVVDAGDRVAYTWTQTSGAAVDLSDPTEKITTFSPTTTGVYTFSFKASINGVTKTVQTTITVS